MLPLWFSQMFLLYMSSWNVVRLKIRDWFFAGCITCESACSNGAIPKFMWLSFILSVELKASTHSCFLSFDCWSARYYDEPSDHFHIRQQYCQQRVRKIWYCLVLDIWLHWFHERNQIQRCRSKKGITTLWTSVCFKRRGNATV